MHIAWDSLGLVFLVSFGSAVGVIVLFSFGVAALTSPAQSSPEHVKAPLLGIRQIVAVLCFLACALMVGYGLYVIVNR